MNLPEEANVLPDVSNWTLGTTSDSSPKAKPLRAVGGNLWLTSPANHQDRHSWLSMWRQLKGRCFPGANSRLPTEVLSAGSRLLCSYRLELGALLRGPHLSSPVLSMAHFTEEQPSVRVELVGDTPLHPAQASEDPRRHMTRACPALGLTTGSCVTPTTPAESPLGEGEQWSQDETVLESG